MKKNEAEKSRASRLENSVSRRLAHTEIISDQRDKSIANQSCKIILEKEARNEESRLERR